jgi:type I restriction enzyme S subunit
MKQGWERKKIDDVCLIKGRIGYRGYTKQDLVDKGEGAISLSPSNIKDNKLFFDKCTYISWQKYEESPEIMIFEGDIIYCKTASIGKMALVEVVST